MNNSKFIPKAKLSKKKRQELNRQQRRTWDHSPVTRVIPNKKKSQQWKCDHPDLNDSDGRFSFTTHQKTAGRKPAAVTRYGAIC